MRVKFKGAEYDSAPQGVLGSVLFERKFGVAFSEAFNEQSTPRMEWMAYLAYTELQGDKVEVGEFDDAFLANLEFLGEAPVAPAETGSTEVDGQTPLDLAAQPI